MYISQGEWIIEGDPYLAESILETTHSKIQTYHVIANKINIFSPLPYFTYPTPNPSIDNGHKTRREQCDNIKSSFIQY